MAGFEQDPEYTEPRMIYYQRPTPPTGTSEENSDSDIVHGNWYLRKLWYIKDYESALIILLKMCLFKLRYIYIILFGSQVCTIIFGSM